MTMNLITARTAIVLLCLAAQQPDVDAQVKALRAALTSAVDALAEGLKPTRLVVRTFAELQAAVDVAPAGFTIALVPGEYVGTLLLKARPRTDYVTITTDGLTLPEARVTSGAGLAVLRSATNLPAVQTEPGASYYRFVGVAFGANPGGHDDIIRIGDSQDPDPSHVPHHFVFDRIYAAGGPINGQRRGIAANGADITITRSTLENFWKLGQDSQAIAIWSGPGPLVVTNNHLQAASENFIAGGTPPASVAQLPCDILFEDNDLDKRPEWREANGKSVKNLFELKVACRVRVINNRMKGNWPDGQSGYAILFTVATNVSGLPGCPFCSLTDVRFERNTITDVAAGIQILGSAYSSPSGGLDNLTIVNNLFVISSATMLGPGGKRGNGFVMTLEGGPTDVVIEHNTFINDGSSFVNATLGKTWFSGPAPIPALPPRGFIFRSNVVLNGAYGLFTPTGANGRGIAWFGDAMVEDNVIIGADTTARYPVSNRRVPLADVASVYDPVTFAIRPAFAGAGKS